MKKTGRPLRERTAGALWTLGTLEKDIGGGLRGAAAFQDLAGDVEVDAEGHGEPLRFGVRVAGLGEDVHPPALDVSLLPRRSLYLVVTGMTTRQIAAHR